MWLSKISDALQSLPHPSRSRSPNPGLSTLISGGACGSVPRADQHIPLTPLPQRSLPSDSVTLTHTTLCLYTLSHTLSLTHSLTLTRSGGARGWVLRADEHLRALVRRLDVRLRLQEVLGATPSLSRIRCTLRSLALFLVSLADPHTLSLNLNHPPHTCFSDALHALSLFSLLSSLSRTQTHKSL
jgi:hypothetical protein